MLYTRSLVNNYVSVEWTNGDKSYKWQYIIWNVSHVNYTRKWTPGNTVMTAWFNFISSGWFMSKFSVDKISQYYHHRNPYFKKVLHPKTSQILHSQVKNIFGMTTSVGSYSTHFFISGAQLKWGKGDKKEKPQHWRDGDSEDWRSVHYCQYYASIMFNL